MTYFSSVSANGRRRDGAVPTGSRPRTTLGNAQRLGLAAMVALASGTVMAWNGLTGHVAASSGFNGGLDPVSIARSDLDASALRWISIRAGAAGYSVDFAPILTDAAALSSVRYGVDRSMPDRTLDLPAGRHVWPLPPERLGTHVLILPLASRTISVSVTFADGTGSPVLVYPLRRALP